MWVWLSEFSHVVCWNSSLRFGVHCFFFFHLHTTRVNRLPKSKVRYRRRTEDVTRLYVHGMCEEMGSVLYGDVILVTSSDIGIANCARFSTVTQILFKSEETHRNRLCLFILVIWYSWHTVYKIRFALRTLKVIGVKGEDFHNVEWKYSRTRL